jgi:enterochelin esterase family protein
MPYQIDGFRVRFTAPDGATALIGDFTDGTDRPIRLEAGSSLTLEFPRGAYVEYAFLDTNGQPFADPTNPGKAQNPWYTYFRAVTLPGYAPNPLRDALENAPRGKVERISWAGKVLSGTRRAYVYTPPDLKPDRTYPVFYVQDGVAYYRTGKLNAVLDNLLHLRRVHPAVLVFLEPNDRTQEYFFNPAYLEFLMLEALPQIESRYPVSHEANQRGLWGASLGGLASLWTAFQHPDMFGHVVTQSGAFQGQPGRPYKRANLRFGNDPHDTHEWLLEQIQSSHASALRISQDCGQLEWLIATNRRIAAALWDRGYTHQYLERPSGHNWVTWRDTLSDHLEYMLS